jgi:hypothetical protein
MKRNRSLPTLWEAAIVKTDKGRNVWLSLHGEKSSANALRVLATGSHVGVVVGDFDLCQPAAAPPGQKKKMPVATDHVGQGKHMSTYVVGMCLTSHQKAVVNRLVRIEKAAFALSRYLYMRTVRGQHMVAWHSEDDDEKRAARDAPKGQDGKGNLLEETKNVWKRIQAIVVSSKRQRSEERLGQEDVDLLPPEWYFEGCTQPQLGGFSRFKAAVRGCFKTVRRWKGTNNDDDGGIPDWNDMDSRVSCGGFLVQKMYCRLVPEAQLKLLGAGAFSTKKSISIIPTVMAGSANRPKTLRDAKERFVRLTRNVDTLPPFDHDLRIVKAGPGRFRLHIPCEVAWTRRCKPKDETASEAVCAIDPGGRTFATVFDGTRNAAFQYGTAAQKEEWILPLLKEEDAVRSQLQQAVNKGQSEHRLALRRRLEKCKRRLRDRVTGVHRQLTGYLAGRHALVVVGHINVPSIVKKERTTLTGAPAGYRTINKTSTRHLLAWCHAGFRDRLLHRQRGDHSFSVFVQEESWTSKTCGRCDKKNRNLGGAETFYCNGCNYRTHRDVNGARNILRKALGTFPSF